MAPVTLPSQHRVEDALSLIADAIARRAMIRLVIRTVGREEVCFVEGLPCGFGAGDRPTTVLFEHRNAVWRRTRSVILLTSIVSLELIRAEAG